MTPENFCYWLQGYFELTHDDFILEGDQIQIIQDHLNLVFDKKTPDRLKKSDNNGYQPLYTSPTGVKAQGLCGMVDSNSLELGKQFKANIEKPVC